MGNEDRSMRIHFCPGSQWAGGSTINASQSRVSNVFTMR